MHACDSTFHGPPGPARRPGRPRRPRRQPALVVASRDPGRLRGGRSRAVGVQRPRPGAADRRGRPRAARRARRRRGLPASGWGRPRPTWTATCPRTAGTRRRGPEHAPEGDRLLLPGVRHHRRAAAVLRRPRHPRRRPPQGGQRPRRPDRRRRPALPPRLLQAVAVAGGLAAGDLPDPRPRRPADLAAATRPTAPGPPSPSRCPAGPT